MKIFKTRIILIGTISALIIIAVASFDGSIKDNETLSEPLQGNIEQLAILPEETNTPHSVSLPTLMEKNYDGRDLKIGSVLDENEVYTRYFITYKSGSLTISGIMNIPKGSGPFPLLVLNHGHIDTSVYTNGRGLKREQDYLARHGYAVIHPDYRNHAGSDKDPDAEYNFRLGYTEDVINAILAVRNAKLANIDVEKVGMLGHSMGGGVAQNVMVVRPDLVKAFVLFAPVSGDVRDNFERWVSRRFEVAQRIIETYGNPSDNPSFWDNISPRNFLSKVEAPVLIHHGTSDESVPLEWSQKLQEGLSAADKDVTFYVYENEPHEFINAWPLVMKRTLEFFDKNLK